jgi:eukaryotic-like serine/threonine-protein kinase
MALVAGTRLGHYEVVAPLGAGGMGEVYRARDTRLDRTVAVKVLSPEIASDPERRARFEREAKAVAAISHPNILSIFDFGAQEGIAYAVMELLEGETLQEALRGGALPLRRATDGALQIAQGLAAAHEKGVVHRDLKPGNVFMTKDGRVKILDFGLAKPTTAGPASVDTRSPTMSAWTEPGTVMGTVGYMSPEQVKGLPVDHRSDLFSFGAVLYEMLAGKRAFQRDTAAETMTAILKEDPPEAADSGRSIPPALDRIVRHCLEKKPEQRFQSASDIAFDLQGALGLSGVEAGATPVSRVRPTWRLPWAAGLLAVGCALGAAVTWSFRPAAPEPVRVRPLTFSGHDGEPSASPDGRMVAFTSTRDGVSRIWIKQLSGGEAPLTSGRDRRPRFSPDGSSVLFVRGEGATLAAYRVPLVGGEPRKILDDVAEADWSPDGHRIAFLRSRVSNRTEWTLGVAEIQSGRETVLTAVSDFLLLHVRWSPDGRTIAVIKSIAVGFVPGDELLLVDVSGGHIRALTPKQPNLSVCGLAWSGRGGAIVFGQSGSRMGDSSGAPAAVIRKSIASGRERTLFWASNLFPMIGASKLFASFDVLGPGRLVFDEMAQRLNLREVPIGPGLPSRSDRVLTAGSSRDRQPAYSPDGGQVVFSSNRSGNLDLWALSTTTGALRQLTDDPAQDWDPAFTPDGKHILWSSDRSGNLEIWMAGADGSGARQVSRDGADAENPTATPDGAWIVYGSGDPAKNGIWKIRPDGSGAARLVPGFYSNAEVSPDSRFATFVKLDIARPMNSIGAVEIATGRLIPFEIQAHYRLGPDASRVQMGRSRWLPDGKAIAWIGEDENGRTGVFAQDFVPGRDTSSTRRKLAGFSPDYVTESFGISPDGRTLALSTLTRFGGLMIAEGVPDVEPLRRAGPGP